MPDGIFYKKTPGASFLTSPKQKNNYVKNNIETQFMRLNFLQFINLNARKDRLANHYLME